MFLPRGLQGPGNVVAGRLQRSGAENFLGGEAGVAKIIVAECGVYKKHQAGRAEFAGDEQSFWRAQVYWKSLFKIDLTATPGVVTRPSFCTTASERVYITATDCEIKMDGTKGLQAAGAGGL